MERKKNKIDLADGVYRWMVPHDRPSGVRQLALGKKEKESRIGWENSPPLKASLQRRGCVDAMTRRDTSTGIHNNNPQPTTFITYFLPHGCFRSFQCVW
jgi:hypothetical protein